MDASNMLKPTLARGELHCIGATTLDEYRKHIEKDAALERRFQPVLVDAADASRTRSRSCAACASATRSTTASGSRDSALVAAATLSNRYITDRFLPDKAIDLVDEAASRLRMEIDSMPIELDELERRRHAARDRARGSAQGEGRRLEGRLEALETELARSPSRPGRLKAALGDREGSDRRTARSTKEELERPAAIEQAEREGDSARQPELQYGTLAELQERMKRQEAAPRREPTATRACSRRRSTRRTSPRSSPPGRGSRSAGCMEGEIGRSSLQMEDALHERVVGQDEAIRRSRDAVRRARAGLRGPAPADRLLHLPRPDRRRQDRAGPGAGGVPLRRRATPWCGIDMSEYMEKHTVSRLIGAPPGYVGYEEGGQLTEAVRRRPYQRGALRRDREGAPGRVQRPAAGPGRRPPDRRPGPHGGLQEHAS